MINVIEWTSFNVGEESSRRTFQVHTHWLVMHHPSVLLFADQHSVLVFSKSNIVNRRIIEKHKVISKTRNYKYYLFRPLTQCSYIDSLPEHLVDILDLRFRQLSEIILNYIFGLDTSGRILPFRFNYVSHVSLFYQIILVFL